MLESKRQEQQQEQKHQQDSKDSEASKGSATASTAKCPAPDLILNVWTRQQQSASSKQQIAQLKMMQIKRRKVVIIDVNTGSDDVVDE